MTRCGNRPPVARMRQLESRASTVPATRAHTQVRKEGGWLPIWAHSLSLDYLGPITLTTIAESSVEDDETEVESCTSIEAVSPRISNLL